MQEKAGNLEGSKSAKGLKTLLPLPTPNKRSHFCSIPMLSKILNIEFISSHNEILLQSKLVREIQLLQKGIQGFKIATK